MASVTRIGRGVYRVEHDGRQDLVYVAGDRGHTSAFWDGEVFYESAPPAEETGESDQASGAAQPLPQGAHVLASPMPATIVKIVAVPGTAFKRGETLIVVEAMKMELPLSAEHDGVVKAVLCQEGDLVQAGQTLVELE
jgi:biotin carboxyl carrier protein